MEDYNDKLKDFGQQLKRIESKSPIQKVKPVNIELKENIIRATVHLPEETHTKIKVLCAKKGITLKDYVTDVLTKSISDHKNTEK